MDLLEQLEHPIPILKVESERIIIETSQNAKGRFPVTNIGGGKLEGKVMTNNPYFRFLQTEFSGNSVRLEYETSIEGFKPGDLIRTDAVIMSNGGEKTISVVIKIVSTVVETPDNQKITNLKDFMMYTKKNPAGAGSIFFSKVFKTWLSDIGNEYIDIFNFIVQDSNKERAIENFLVLNRQKNRPTLSVAEKHFSHEINPTETKTITGTFNVKKNGWGYIECPISIKNSDPWLTVKPNIISSGLFDANETAEINYFIEPKLIDSKIAKAVISIAEFDEIDVTVRKKPLFECVAKKESYLFEDTGALTIVNNSGADIFFDIIPNESFLKFEGKRYLVGSYAEIPFKVKLTGIQSAQLSIKRQPVVLAEISVKAEYEKIKFKKTVKIMLGDL